MERINVLWMNNGDEGLMKYVDMASKRQINVTTCECMTECRHLLRDKSFIWDAVLLNAEVKTTSPKEKANINNLQAALDYLKKHEDVPWFIITEVETEIITDGLKWLLSGKKYYNIKTKADELFKDIREAVTNNPLFLVSQKYTDVFDFCNEPRLKELLIKLEYNEKELEKDDTVPNICRDLLEWLEISDVFKKYRYSYKEIGRILGKDKSLPPHIRRSFHFCIEVTNQGSHGNLPTKRLIRSGDVPYLNKSLIFNLLNVLYWCATLDENSFQTIVSNYERQNNIEGTGF